MTFVWILAFPPIFVFFAQTTDCWRQWKWYYSAAI